VVPDEDSHVPSSMRKEVIDRRQYRHALRNVIRESSISGEEEVSVPDEYVSDAAALDGLYYRSSDKPSVKL
jgi:hypothetical protein